MDPRIQMLLQFLQSQGANVAGRAAPLAGSLAGILGAARGNPGRAALGAGAAVGGLGLAASLNGGQGGPTATPTPGVNPQGSTAPDASTMDQRIAALKAAGVDADTAFTILFAASPIAIDPQARAAFAAQYNAQPGGRAPMPTPGPVQNGPMQGGAPASNPLAADAVMGATATPLPRPAAGGPLAGAAPGGAPSPQPGPAAGPAVPPRPAGGPPISALANGQAQLPPGTVDQKVEALQYSPLNPDASITNALRAFGLPSFGRAGGQLQGLMQPAFTQALAGQGIQGGADMKQALMAAMAGGRQDPRNAINSFLGAEGTLQKLASANPGMNLGGMVSAANDPNNPNRGAAQGQMGSVFGGTPDALRAAYMSQIEGNPGDVGALFANSLAGGTGSGAMDPRMSGMLSQFLGSLLANRQTANPLAENSFGYLNSLFSGY